MTMMFTASRCLLQQQRSCTLARRTSVLFALNRTPPLLQFSRNSAFRLATSSSNGPGGGGGFFTRNKRIILGFGSAIVGLNGYTAYTMQRDKADWQEQAKVILLLTPAPEATIEEELENCQRLNTMDEKALSWYDIGRIYYTYYTTLKQRMEVTQEDPQLDPARLLALRELTFSELKQTLERDDVHAVKIVMYLGDVTFEEVKETVRVGRGDACLGTCLAEVECLTRRGDESSSSLTFHIKLENGIKSCFELAHEFGYNIKMDNKKAHKQFVSTIILFLRDSDLHQ